MIINFHILSRLMKLVTVFIILAYIHAIFALNDDGERGIRGPPKKERKRLSKPIFKDPSIDHMGKEKVKQYGKDKGKSREKWEPDGATAGIIEGDIDLARMRGSRIRRKRKPQEEERMRRKREDKRARRAARRVRRIDPNDPNTSAESAESREERRAKRQEHRAKRRREFEEQGFTAEHFVERNRDRKGNRPPLDEAAGREGTTPE